jgi:large subunit ribosomal protein L25
MSALHLIEAEARTNAGTGPARETRRQGRVPGILYGGNQEAILLSVDPRVLYKELRQTGFFSKLFEVKIGAKKERAIVKDVQFHPVTDQPIHIDFLRISKDKKIHVSVPVTFLNEDKCPALKKGGVLNIIAHNLELMCDPEHLPDHINVDLAGLEVGQSLHISQLVLPQGAAPLASSQDITILTLVAPTVAVETATEAAPAASASADASDKDKKGPAGK